MKLILGREGRSGAGTEGTPSPSARYERLEEQLNDLTELHQNEMTNLKQELASMEEKVAYQSYERARDIQVRPGTDLGGPRHAERAVSGLSVRALPTGEGSGHSLFYRWLRWARGWRGWRGAEVGARQALDWICESRWLRATL